jgi:hypothetical protein
MQAHETGGIGRTIWYVGMTKGEGDAQQMDFFEKPSIIESLCIETVIIHMY